MGDVKTDERALDTVYQNDTDKPILVAVTVVCTSTTKDGHAYVTGFYKASQICRTGILGGGARGDFFQISMVVPVGSFYKVEKFECNGSVELFEWVEVEL